MGHPLWSYKSSRYGSTLSPWYHQDITHLTTPQLLATPGLVIEIPAVVRSLLGLECKNTSQTVTVISGKERYDSAFSAVGRLAYFTLLPVGGTLLSCRR